MTVSLRTFRIALFLGPIVLSMSLASTGQDASGQSSSLGDVARATRKEHVSASHVPAKQVTNEEEDGPDTGGVWRAKLCPQTPCYELSVTLPKSPKWIRATSEPRPVLIPLPGSEDDPSHAIRVYAAESIPPAYYSDRAARIFLQGWFARPEYFGQAARLVLNEHVLLDGRMALISHFTVASGELKYRGLSVVAGSSYGNFGFACVFRDEDAKTAASMCDAIVKSAKAQVLQPGTPRVYPNPHGYNPPGYYPQGYPPDDPPETDDPE